MSEDQQEVALEAATTTDVADEVETQDDQPEAKAPEQKTQEADEKTATQARRERRKRKAEEIQRQLQEAEAKAQAAEKAIPTNDGEPPNEKDFPSYEAYQAALTAHYLSATLGQRETARAKQEAEQARLQLEAAKKAKAAETRENWEVQAQEARSKYADFDAVFFAPGVVVTDSMADLIATSDSGGDVAYHLGKNPDLSVRIANMDPVSQAREIGRLEALVAAPPAKTKSAAPPPISPVTGNSGASGYRPDMTASEFRAWRNAGGTF